MDLNQAVTDAWASRLGYYQTSLRQAFSSEVPKYPQGFPPGYTATVWGQTLHAVMLGQIAVVQAQGDTIHAEAGKEALDTWVQMGGSKLPSPLEQSRSLEDYLIDHMAGAYLVTILAKQTSNSLGNIPFPMVPPLASRQRTISTCSPRHLARWVAVTLIALPWSEIRVTLDPSAREAQDAVVDAFMGDLMDLGATQDDAAPTSIGKLRDTVEQIQKLALDPSTGKLPTGLRNTLADVADQLRKLETAVDVVQDFPRKAGEDISRAEDVLKEAITALQVIVGGATGLLLVSAFLSRRKGS